MSFSEVSFSDVTMMSFIIKNAELQGAIIMLFLMFFVQCGNEMPNDSLVLIVVATLVIVPLIRFYSKQARISTYRFGSCFSLNHSVCSQII